MIKLIPATKGTMLSELCEKQGIQPAFYVQEDEPTGSKACLKTPDELETSVLNIAAGNAYSKEKHLDGGKSES